MSEEAVIVFITAPGAEEAEKLSAGLLESRLAACTSLVPGAASAFWWKGKIDRADEVLMICKTRASLIQRLSEFVVEHHPYDVPEVVALPIVGGNPEYLKWIMDNTVE